MIPPVARQMEEERPEHNTDLKSEVEHWRAVAAKYERQAEEYKEELEEFQQSSHDLETELEAQLQQSEAKVREYKTQANTLQMDKDKLNERLTKCERELDSRVTSMQSELEEIRNMRDHLAGQVRSLEQQNDDLERIKRCTIASLEDFETRLNSAIERNVLLESELDERETLREAVQRLKDETRDLKSELASVSVNTDRRNTCNGNSISTPDQQPRQSFFAKNSSNNVGTGDQKRRISTGTRVSALNIVSDLLHRVRSLELKLMTKNRVSTTAKSGGGENTAENEDGMSPMRMTRSQTSLLTLNTCSQSTNVDTNTEINQ